MRKDAFKSQNGLKHLTLHLKDDRQVFIIRKTDICNVFKLSWELQANSLVTFFSNANLFRYLPLYHQDKYSMNLMHILALDGDNASVFFETKWFRKHFQVCFNVS